MGSIRISSAGVKERPAAPKPRPKPRLAAEPAAATCHTPVRPDAPECDGCGLVKGWYVPAGGLGCYLCPRCVRYDCDVPAAAVRGADLAHLLNRLHDILNVATIVAGDILDHRLADIRALPQFESHGIWHALTTTRSIIELLIHDGPVGSRLSRRGAGDVEEWQQAVAGLDADGCRCHGKAVPK